MTYFCQKTGSENGCITSSFNCNLLESGVLKDLQVNAPYTHTFKNWFNHTLHRWWNLWAMTKLQDLHSCGQKNKQWQTKKIFGQGIRTRISFMLVYKLLSSMFSLPRKNIVQPGANNYIKLHNFCRQTFTQTTEELCTMWRSFQDRYKTPRS